MADIRNWQVGADVGPPGCDGRLLAMCSGEVMTVSHDSDRERGTSIHEIARPHRIAVIAPPGLLPLDFGIPVHAFDFESYEVTVCGEGPVEDAQGHTTIVPPADLNAAELADTVIVPGYFPVARRPSQALIDQLRNAHARGARVASICVGAFALGYAGLLDNRQATTHWMHLDTLAAAFPNARVRSDVLYITDDRVCTSAGVASGIDLCLNLIRTDFGAAVANQRGRALVAAPHRSGDQRQFVEYFAPELGTDAVAATRDWLLSRLDESVTLAEMAAHANMSTRNFSRRFNAATGMAPLKWLQAARIDRARMLLETSAMSIEKVARACGLGTPANFRRIFAHHVGISPLDYRQLYPR
jgi:transcriptional regulator GlxA family with amidase domain